MGMNLNERSDVECRGCQERLYEIGSFLVCGMDRCDRWAIPVDQQGRTEEEAHADAIAPLVPDADATGCSEAGFTEYLRTHSDHTAFGYARND